MVSIVGRETPLPIAEGPPNSEALRITVRPNCAGRDKAGLVALAITTAITVAVGVGFALAGAWPVGVCAVAAPLGIAAALFHLHRHAGDYERITLGPRDLTIDRRRGRSFRHYEFNPYWVSLVTHPTPSGGFDYLALRSHGRELPLGSDLTDRERERIGELLQSALPRLQG